MKKTSSKFYIIMILAMTLILAGCSSSYESKNDGRVEIGQDSAVPESPGWDYSEEKGEVGKDSDEASGENPGQDQLLYNSNDKIIRRINLSLETQAFDDLINSIEGQVSELGGYIEMSKITGRHYNHENLRYGTIVARIPKETVNGFVKNIGDIANVTMKAENIENVSLKYVDIEARTEALEIEQERLLTLLERAQEIEVIISLESRLTSVRYELQSLKTEIRTIDNLVDYSTLTMEVQEVRLMGSSIDADDSIGERISRGLERTLYNMKEGFANFIVWFVVNIPYIIIWIIILILIIFSLVRIVNMGKRGKDLVYKNKDDMGEDTKPKKSDRSL